MDKLVSLIKDKSYLIVCDSNASIKYLIKKFNKKLVDISYITFNELAKKLNFVSNDSIILAVMNEFSLSYDTANLYINNILQTNYLIEKDCDSDKLLQIYEIKKFLIEKDLYNKDELINHYLSNKEIIVYSDSLDEFQKYLLKDINYTFVSYLDNVDEELTCDILEFKTIDEEIAYTCERIIDCLLNGVSKKDIYLVVESNDYIYSLKRISKMFNLDFDINNNINLLSISFVKELLNKYFNNEFDNVDTSLLSDEEYELYKQFIATVNKYVKYSDDLLYKNFLMAKLASVSKKEEKNINAIKLISLEEAFYLSKIDNNAHIFLLGMYQGNIPHIVKDEDYYSDAIKFKNNIFDSAKRNTLNQLFVKEFIYNCNNLQLSYSKKANFNEYIISSIVNLINVNVIKKDFYISKYSNKYNKEVYYKKFDTYSKYGTMDESLGLLNSTYNDNTYLSYNNKFKGINSNDVLRRKDYKLRLSYSSLNTYSKCAFSYYLEHILGLKAFKGNFMTFVGSVYHNVIEMFYKKKDFDFESEYNIALEKESLNYQMTTSEIALMKKLKEELKDVLRYLNDQMEFINYKDAMFEQEAKIYSKLNHNGKDVDLYFSGKIDKLHYKKVELDGEEVTLVAIVDYKTSSKIKFEVELVAYGLSLQLPIYALLASNIKGIDNVIVGAMFIQPILDSKLLEENNSLEEYMQEKDRNRKLDGCVNTDLVDGNKFASDVIVTNKSHKYSSEAINELVKDVNSIIDRTFIDIAQAKFDINPKRVGKKDYGCEYCCFKDICYKTEKDYVDINVNKEDQDA